MTTTVFRSIAALLLAASFGHAQVPTFVDSRVRFGPAGTFEVRAVDLDGDGDLDLVEISNIAEPNRIYRNDGPGRFTPTGALGANNTHALAVGDVDGDGDPDLVFGNAYEPNQVFLNDGRGRFTDRGVALGANPTWALAAGDLDGDGDLDLVEGNATVDVPVGGPANVIWWGDGTGNFTAGPSLGAQDTVGLAVVDVDSDGDLDILEATANGQPNTIWLNLGAGAFVPAAARLGTGSALGLDLGDVDGDGNVDCVLGILGGGIELYLGNGAGSFLGPIAVPAPGGHPLLADLDGDRDLDLAVGVERGPCRILVNDGLGFLTDSGQRLGLYDTRSLAVVDVDRDGVADLVEANFWQDNVVWLGR